MKIGTVAAEITIERLAPLRNHGIEVQSNNERERRELERDVVRQLRLRKAEKHQRHDDPRECQAPQAREIRRRRRRAQSRNAVPDADRKKRDPREKAKDQNRADSTRTDRIDSRSRRCSARTCSVRSYVRMRADPVCTIHRDQPRRDDERRRPARPKSHAAPRRETRRSCRSFQKA